MLKERIRDNPLRAERSLKRKLSAALNEVQRVTTKHEAIVDEYETSMAVELAKCDAAIQKLNRNTIGATPHRPR